MQDGDTSQCWTYKGYASPDIPSGVIRIGGERYIVRRLVYSVYAGIDYDKLPQLIAGCGNEMCSNPTHTVAKKGSKVIP